MRQIGLQEKVVAIVVALLLARIAQAKKELSSPSHLRPNRF